MANSKSNSSPVPASAPASGRGKQTAELHQHGPTGHDAGHNTGHNTGHETGHVTGHDHGPCLAQSLGRAERTFVDQGLKLTPLRRRVLEEVAGSHDAVGAYDVLESLSRKTGTRIAPISVYRALDVLQAAGVIHRVESKNAFFACHADHDQKQRPVVLVCDRCRGVTEVVASTAFIPIDAVAAAYGFKTRQTVVEIAGQCKACTNVTAGPV
jgi:Fur family transcriptional regulator, zinc uptake regulator